MTAPTAPIMHTARADRETGRALLALSCIMAASLPAAALGWTLPLALPVGMLALALLLVGANTRGIWRLAALPFAYLALAICAIYKYTRRARHWLVLYWWAISRLVPRYVTHACRLYVW